MGPLYQLFSLPVHAVLSVSLDFMTLIVGLPSCRVVFSSPFLFAAFTCQACCMTPNKIDELEEIIHLIKAERGQGAGMHGNIYIKKTDS